MPFGVVGGVGLGMGVLDFGGDRRRGRGSLGEYNAEMAYWSIIDSCVKSWQYFPMQNVSLNSASRAESYSARLVSNGDNMQGLCHPSNFLLIEYPFYPPRSDALFSVYFEDLLSHTVHRCGLLLHVARDTMSVSPCWAYRWAVQKRQSRSSCRLVCKLRAPKIYI